MTDFPAADLRHDDDLAEGWPHPDAAGASHDDSAADAAPAPPPSERGWTNAAQASFLEVLSQGSTVAVSAHFVGLARAGAYALRHRDPLFAKGWAAAELLARDCVAEIAATRAIDGYTETTEWSPDRLVRTRHRHDNRLLMATLTRLDRQADASRTTKAGGEIRASADDFAGFLERLRRGSAEAAAYAARHRMNEAAIAQVEAARGKLIQNMAMFGLEMREQRILSGLPTTDLDAIMDKICVVLGEPPFDWEGATHEEALARKADEILDAREQDVVFSWDEDNQARGEALARAEALAGAEAARRAEAGADTEPPREAESGAVDAKGAAAAATPAPIQMAEPRAAFADTPRAGRDEHAGMRPLCPVEAAEAPSGALAASWIPPRAAGPCVRQL